MTSRLLSARGRLEEHAWLAALLLGALAIALGMAKYGLGLYSGWELLFGVTTHLSNPHEVVDVSQDFILKSAGIAALLGLLGVKSSAVWLAVHVVLAMTALIMPFLLPPFRGSTRSAQMLFIVVTGGPILALLLLWVGSYDALPIIGLVVIALVRSPWWQALGWLLVGLLHSELGLVALVTLVSFKCLSGRLAPRVMPLLRELMVGVPGLALGWCVTAWMVAQWGGSTSRLELLFANPGHYFNLNLVMMPMALFSTLGVTWFLALQSSVLRKRTTRALLVLAVPLSIFLPFVAVDHTRVVSLVMLPVVLIWIADLTSAETEGWWRTFGPIGAILPITVYIAGITLTSGFINYFSWRLQTGMLP